MQPIRPGVALRSAQWYAGLLTLTLALAAAPAATAQQKNLVYNTVTPCPVVDTRVAGGALAPSETRTFNVVGNGSFANQGGSSTGCGVPGFSNGVAQVQAVVLNIAAVNSSATGFLDVYAADQFFSSSVINFQAGWGAIADSATVAVAQTSGVGDFKVTVCCATVHLIARIVGYYTKPVQTVVVNAVPGDVTASGTALVNALAAISNASAARPYVVKLGPGIYDIGDTRLQMKSFVDVEGSGQQATILQGNGNSGSNDYLHGVVLGADSMELRNLQIKSNGSASRPSAIAVYNGLTSPRITNVTVVASGGAANWGIRNAGGSPTIEGTTINVTGGPSSFNNYGIVATGYGPISAPILKRSVITVTTSGSSSNATGIYSDQESLPMEVRDVEVNVSGGAIAIGYHVDGTQGSGSPSGTILQSTFNVHGTVRSYGVYIQSLPTLEIKGSNLTASGGSSYGVYAEGNTVVRVDHSEIAGGTNSVVGFTAIPIAIGATRLGGPTSGGLRCAGVYDQNLNFYTNTCP